MPDSSGKRAEVSSKLQHSPELDKWEECYKTGISMIIGGVIMGSCFSILTLTPFPFLVLSTVGIYSAVENCDNIFRGVAAAKSNEKMKKK